MGGEDRDGIELEVSYVHLEDRDHYLVRSFILTDTASGEKRKVKQFHYLDWPDFNVPKSPKYFLEFLYAIRESGCFSENSGPPVVHCSAGIGRWWTLAWCWPLWGWSSTSRLFSTLFST